MTSDVTGMTDWQKLERDYFMRTFQRVPLILVRGEGCHAWDERGRQYLDFVGGWAVNSLGHCHPVVTEALTEQARTLIQVSNQFYTIPQIRLAELLVQHTCLDKVFFCNSGAEANEGAVKLARRYGKLHLQGAYEIITTFDSFHGRTLAMVAATGQKKFQEPYVPLPNGFVNVEYNSIEAISKVTRKETCAIMLEAIQAEGGVNVPSEDYLKNVRDWCDENGLLFILDEIQTGLGRTGALFAYQACGIEPDIMTLAKGLASGVPIGAILCKNKVDVFRPGEHGSTFGGNPLVCSAAFAATKFIIDNDVSGNAGMVGRYLESKLHELKSKYGFVVDVRGKGLLLAMEFDRDIADDAVMSCLGKGLLLNRVKPNVIRFIPPLIVTEAEIDEATELLDDVLSLYDS